MGGDPTNMNRHVPQTYDEATSYLGWRALVIFGGILGLIFLAPTSFLAWFLIGLVLVPLVWILTGRRKRAMMRASGSTSPEEWKAFLKTLPKRGKSATTTHAAQVGPATRRGPAFHSPQTKSPRSTAKSSRTAIAPKKTPSNRPPTLDFPEYPLIVSSSYANYEVVGESWREKDVIKALGGLSVGQERTIEDVVTYLVPEPDNPHDPHAVMVWMNGKHVGYLSKEDAKRFAPVLQRVTSQGLLPTTSGRLWGSAQPGYDGKQKTRYHLYARVALNEPAQLVPTNNPPSAPYSILPWGPAVQVTKEDQYLPELTEHLKGEESFAFATIEANEKLQKNGAVKRYVSVLIGGEVIGELTPMMSEKFLPTIDHLSAQGLKAATIAKVKGSLLAIEVTLQASKAHELPNTWLHGPPVTRAALHTDGTTNRQSPSLEQQNASRERNWDF